MDFGRLLVSILMTNKLTEEVAALRRISCFRSSPNQEIKINSFFYPAQLSKPVGEKAELWGVGFRDFYAARDYAQANWPDVKWYVYRVSRLPESCLYTGGPWHELAGWWYVNERIL